MESYDAFNQRIKSFALPELNLGSQDDFTPSASLSDKVSPDGEFRPFYGDTVVFDLDAPSKQALNRIIDRLYAEAPACFSQRLKPESLHLTLLDLVSGKERLSLVTAMTQHQEALANFAQQGAFATAPIQLISHNIFNMVDTSLVMGFLPKTAQDHQRLMALYQQVDQIHSLPYPLTPHVTLTYFNPQGFGSREIAELTECVNQLNQTSLDLTLVPEKLYYQKFQSMGEFDTVLKLDREDRP